MAFERPNTYGAGTGITYDPETLKRVWDELDGRGGRADCCCTRSRSPSSVEDGRVAGVDVATKSGVRRLRGRASSIDASGDADVCALAGAPYEPPGEGVQSLSTVFRMANVDVARAEAVPKAGAVGAACARRATRAGTRSRASRARSTARRTRA